MGGEPNSWQGHEEDCAFTYAEFLSGAFSSEWRDQWNDGPCTRMKLASLCEVPRVQVDGVSNKVTSTPVEESSSGGSTGVGFLAGVGTLLALQGIGFVMVKTGVCKTMKSSSLGSRRKS